MTQGNKNVGWVSDSVTQQNRSPITDQEANVLGYAAINQSTQDIPMEWIQTSIGRALDYGKVEKAEPNQIQNDVWVLELEDIEKDSSKVIQKLMFSDRQSKSTKNRFKKGDVLRVS